MRILLVSHRYPPDGVAGVERYTERLALELARDGHRVAVLTHKIDESKPIVELQIEVDPNGIAIYRLVGRAPSSPQFLVENERLGELFRDVLTVTTPQVVHVNHVMHLSPRYLEMARRSGAAVVLTLHDHYFACPLAHLQKVSGESCAGPDAGRECARTCFAGEGPETFLRWGLRSVYFRRLLGVPHRVISPSRYVADYFQEYAPDSCRLSVLPNGIPMDEQGSASGAPEANGRRLRLATLGAVAPLKGLQTILDALRVADLGGAELLILGVVADQEYASRLRESAERIPGATVHFYGAYNPAELPLLLDGVDLVITPSRVPETFSLTTREALALGIPVLVSRIGALPEAIREGENGYTFDATSPGELAMLLERFAGDENLREQLRRGAAATDVLTMRAHTGAIIEVYRDALRRARTERLPEVDVRELEFLWTSLIEVGFASR